MYRRIANLGIGDCLLKINTETESETIANWLNSESILLGQGFEMTFQLRKGFDASFTFGFVMGNYIMPVLFNLLF